MLRKQPNVNTKLLEDRISDIKQRLNNLECSDDRLFTNGNGNLPVYNSLQDELRLLQNQLITTRCN